jgi:Ni/Co efflux regulator RcnB
MKTQRIVAAVAAASLAFSSAAFAQSEGAREQSTRGQYRTDQRDYHVDQRNYHGNDNRGHDYRNYGYQEGGYRGHGRGAGPEHSFYRGERLPTYYRSRQYVVDDWRGHHLYAPPQGYHWVQAGGDYVLAAIATGVIAAILLNQ